MKKLLCLALVASLSACATMPAVDACKYSTARRTVYTTAIAAADAYTASGRPVPREVTLGRQAAAVALAVLDRNCPDPAAR